jgi:hypothetical protein
MENRKRIIFAGKGGLFCAIVGSLLGGVVVLLVRAVHGNAGGNVGEILEFFPVAVLYAAIPAAPFGFIMGSVGSWWLATRARQGVQGLRLYCESIGAGALLGATFPLVMTALGWGPFSNLVSAMPISIAIGAVCAFALIPFMQRQLAGNDGTGTEMKVDGRVTKT